MTNEGRLTKLVADDCYRSFPSLLAFLLLMMEKEQMLLEMIGLNNLVMLERTMFGL